MATTRLHFHVDVPKERLDALERRDEIMEKLKELGIRWSMTDCGTDIYLVDQGIPTLGDRLSATNEALAEYQAASNELHYTDPEGL